MTSPRRLSYLRTCFITIASDPLTALVPAASEGGGGGGGPGPSALRNPSTGELIRDPGRLPQIIADFWRDVSALPSETELPATVKQQAKAQVLEALRSHPLRLPGGPTRGDPVGRPEVTSAEMVAALKAPHGPKSPPRQSAGMGWAAGGAIQSLQPATRPAPGAPLHRHRHHGQRCSYVCLSYLSVHRHLHSRQHVPQRHDPAHVPVQHSPPVRQDLVRHDAWGRERRGGEGAARGSDKQQSCVLGADPGRQ
jgi:hypothetical protein